VRPTPSHSLPALAITLALLAQGPGVARAQVTETGVTLAWTAPGDDSLSGQATRYDLRWSTTPITSFADFALATAVAGLGAPHPAGSAESATVSGLTPSTTYYFSLRTFDEVGNGSGLSNLLQVTTSPSTDVLRPAPVPLALLASTNTTVTLGWTDVGDDSLTGVATEVEVRWSTAPITEGNWDVATAAFGEPTPGPPGTPEQFVVSGLDRTRDLWFAARARDDVNRLSGLDASLLVPHLLDTAPPATPTGATAGIEGGVNVRVRWSANSEPDLAGYFVYRALAAGGPFTRLTSSSIAATSYLDAPAPDTLSAWYAVSAVDASGNESARSAAVRVFLRGGGILAWDAGTPYPNPSPVGSPVTLPLSVPGAGPYDAVVEIQDGAGQHVRTLHVSAAPPGAFALAWDGRNDAGRTCAPGVYRLWVRAGGQSKLVRLVRKP
jgi:chitodextrinase